MPIPNVNQSYIPLNDIQNRIVDSISGLSLKNGVITFYSDKNRTILKDIYKIISTTNGYDYIKLPNPFILSDTGTFADLSGNNILIYFYPFDYNGKLDLYYITIYDSNGNLKDKIEAVPYVSSASIKNNIISDNNLIPNGQFLQQYTWGGAPIVSNGKQDIAYGEWYIKYKNINASFDVSFEKVGIINSPYEKPSGNPKYCCRIASKDISEDEYVTLGIRFKDVNRFSNPTLSLSLFFCSKNNAPGAIIVNNKGEILKDNKGNIVINNNEGYLSDVTIPIYVSLYKNYGTGGSPASSYKINKDPIVIPSFWVNTYFSFDFGSNYGAFLGGSGDDYFAIEINIPQGRLFDLSFTDFYLKLGDSVVGSFPFNLNPVEPYSVNNSLAYNPSSAKENKLYSVLNDIFSLTKANNFVKIKKTMVIGNGQYIPTAGTLWITAEAIGGGGAGGGTRNTGGAFNRTFDFMYAAAGGGAGAYTKYSFSIDILKGNPLIISLGSKGLGEVGTSGGNGGATTISSISGLLINALGGQGGQMSDDRLPTGNPGSGGSASTTGNYSVSSPGENGYIGTISGIYLSASAPVCFITGGSGGNSLYGQGGKQTIRRTYGDPSSTAGNNATGYGSGGGGAVVLHNDGLFPVVYDSKGGDGAPGVVIITEYIGNIQ